MKTRLKARRHAGFVLLCLWIWGGPLLAQDRVSTTAMRTKNVDLIVHQLQICPCWAYVGPHDIETRKKITEIYIGLSAYDTGTIRAGLKRFLNEPGPFDLLCDLKVFAFLRVLFKVPQHYVVTGKRPWLMLMGNPVENDGSIDLLWPYSIDYAGNLSLVGGDGKFFFGGSVWDELPEFDYIASRFGRRSVKKQAIGLLE
jgi:hypothetical protein